MHAIKLVSISVSELPTLLTFATQFDRLRAKWKYGTSHLNRQSFWNGIYVPSAPALKASKACQSSVLRLPYENNDF